MGMLLAHCLAKWAEGTDLLKAMKERRIIEEPKSPWSSPGVLVRKNGDRFAWSSAR